MTDHFAVLDQPRRPWLDAEMLKLRFLALSTESHPDRVHSATEGERQRANQRCAALNAAYNCLREPRERLRHLLELERGKPKDLQRIPAGAIELFDGVARLCREADAVLAQKRQTESPILRAGLFERSLEWTQRLKAFHQGLQSRRDEVLAELKALDRHWDNAPGLGERTQAEERPLDRIEDIYYLLSYIDRWSAQIQERLVQLTI